MNLPNTLTMSRLGLAFLIMVLLAVSMPFSKTLALLLFAVAGITDYLDGAIARKRNLVTSFGQLMDPLTDKVIVCAVFISFVEIACEHRGTFLYSGVKMGEMKIVPLVPAWIVVIIIAREFLVTGLRLIAMNKGKVISAGRWGKHKTVWQIVAIVILLISLSLRDDFLPFFGPDVLKTFNLALPYLSHGISFAVAMVTLASGYLYLVQHRELIVRT